MTIDPTIIPTLIKDLSDKKKNGGPEFDSNSKLGHLIGCSSAIISHILSGDPAKTPPQTSKIWNDVADFLRNEKGWKKLPLTDYIDFPLSRTIYEKMAMAMNKGDIALIYGISGASKTYTANKFRKDNQRRVFIATASPAVNSVNAILKAIAAATGLTVTRGSSADIEFALIEHLKSTGQNRLLVIDEAQHLSQPCIDQIRCIHDKLKDSPRPFGLVIIGNNGIVNKIGQREAYPQILGRLGIQYRIMDIHANNVDKLISVALPGTKKHPELKAEILNSLTKIGGLRRIIATLQDALMLSMAEGEPLSASHFKQAASERELDKQIMNRA